MDDDMIEFSTGGKPTGVTAQKPLGRISEGPRVPRHPTVDAETRAVAAELDAKVDAFQREKMSKTFAATVFSTALSSAMRREYLDSERIPKFGPNYSENVNCNPIEWLRLESVGLGANFKPENASEALESLFSAFHLPGKSRLLFLVSGDGQTGRTSVWLGLQAMQGSESPPRAPGEVLSAFAGANWPGLSFRSGETPDSLELARAKARQERSRGRRPGLRILTGIPAARNKENIASSIDKLATSLRGRSWRYLVVAEPVDAPAVGRIIQSCHELAGRAESVKSFQFGENLSRTISESSSTAEGMTESESQRDMGGGRGVAAGLTAGIAVLGVLCPALAPALGIGQLLKATQPGLSVLLGFGMNQIVGGAKTKTKGTSLTQTVSETLSEASGVNFSETIVNKHAESAAKLIEAQVKRFQLCEGVGAWDVGAYLLGEDEETAEMGANVLKSLLEGDDSHLEPIRVFDLHVRPGQTEDCDPMIALSQFDNPNARAMNGEFVVRHPFGPLFENLRTLVNTRELVRLANFPLTNVPGVPVRRIPTDTGLENAGGEGIPFGTLMFRGDVLEGHPFSIPPSLLAKHALVCGINGSGKTNTILGILGSLLDDVGAPFLVIEPAKQEYVDWAVSRNRLLSKELGGIFKARKSPKWINVYVPGRETWKGEDLEKLQLNPFDFVWVNPGEPPKTLEHIDRLKTVINAAMPMQEILPVLMEELIFMAYGVPRAPRKAGDPFPCWLPKDGSQRFPEFDEKVHLPSFNSLSVQLQRLFRSRTYAKDVQMNLRAALETRIDSFKRGWRKEMLNKDSPRHSRADWEALFEHPTVVNLTSLASDEDKAFFMALLLLFIYEYRQECSELSDCPEPAPKAGKLRHLLVVEEAHRVLGKAEPASSFSANPKQKVSEMFSNMISEVRAYGQGILIADQIPCRLNEDAVKNTNLKIVHKLVSADDRAAMATALNLWDDQERVIGDLGVGEVIVRGDMDKQAVMVKVNKNV